jgi:hypothetical protein
MAPRARVTIEPNRRDNAERHQLTVVFCDLVGSRSPQGSVYGWFTEGFDTPDLKQTKALLDELR